MKEKIVNKRALIIATIIALVFGLYFLRGFFSVILIAIIMSYLFTPLFRWFQRKTKRNGAAASLTFLVSLFVLLIPLALMTFFTVVQVQNILHNLESTQTLTLDGLTAQITEWFNKLLDYLPGDYHLSEATVSQEIEATLTSLAQSFIDFAKNSIGSIANLSIAVVLYIYIFVNLLMYQDKLIRLVKRLDPLGKEASDTYLQKMGATTTAMVRGQFVIALCQGLAEALILQIAGVDGLFFFMFLLFTLLSVIPLGSGIVAIPVGIGMLLTGNIWQGTFVLLGHFLIVTNIDNVLRPRLVPKDVRLNSALTMLGVFAGIAMFGFLGIIIGPVIMILITTTVGLYLESRAAQPTGETAHD